MLTQQQPVAAVQFHIEGVLAGRCGIVAAAVIVPILTALLRVFPVDQRDGALPGLITDAGADDHGGAFGQSARVVLIDVSLDPEAAGLHDGHKGQRIAHLIRATVLIDGLDAAVHRRGDRHIFQSVLQLFHVLDLQRDVIFLFRDIGVDLTDLQRVIHLLIRSRPVLVPLQLLLFLFLHLQLVFHLFQLQLCHFQIQPSLTGVVCKQRVAFLDFLIHLDLNGVHSGVVVFLDLRLTLCRDHAGKTIRQPGGAKAANHGYRLHRRLALRGSTAAGDR